MLAVGPGDRGLVVVRYGRLARTVVCPVVGFLASVTVAVVAWAAGDEWGEKEQQAFLAAVERVAPCVVRIETVGGLERSQRMVVGSGPTTGLIVDPEGYVLSSAFNFFNKPTSILVRLSDGTRRPAQVVANDYSRMLVLLKIESAEPLPAPQFVEARELRVGQWTIAVGRAFDSPRPSISVGILSAVGRVWGKAIQTDAQVSPNNYGGPLIDIQGRVLGLLVPLSPQAESAVSGVEWYDSGIGFAVPAEQIQKILPRLKSGEDLRPGLLGISFRSRNLHTEAPVIKGTYPKSPARLAGFKDGDRIVEIDGSKVQRAAQVKQALTRHYAGESLRLTIRRQGQTIERVLTLASELSPYERPALGLLPMRGDDEDVPGVRVRYVEPEGPAARAGIQAGDVLLSIDDQVASDVDKLRDLLTEMEPEQQVKIRIRRRESEQVVNVVLGSISRAAPPAELPPAHDAVPAQSGQARPQVGMFLKRIAGADKEAQVYVPEAYHESVAHGVVLWLHEPGSPDLEKLAARWKPLCDRHDLILLAPSASHAAGWRPGDQDLLRDLLGQAASVYEIDPARVVVVGQAGSGAAACDMAFSLRDAVRGLAGVDLHWLGELPANDPLHPLAIFLSRSDATRLRPLVERTLQQWRQQKYPVTVRRLAAGALALDDVGLAELSRWIDMLDRI